MLSKNKARTVPRSVAKFMKLALFGEFRKMRYRAFAAWL
jgi:hypothetical protein